jgi:PPOX class probable F420-dependent enzyme
MTGTEAALMALGDQQFVSLTTFRKTGERVSTPVWIARTGDALVVTTPVGSGKVKRLRRDPRVELQPCSRRGRIEETDLPVAGTAQILTDDDGRRRSTKAIRDKYRIEYRIVMGIERIISRRNHERVVLRITPPDPNERLHSG